MKTLTLKQVEKLIENEPSGLQGLCDGLDYLENDAEEGDRAVHTTLGELSSINAGVYVFSPDEPKFAEVGKLYPNVEVYTVLTHENTVMSCDMKIESHEMGEKIGELTGLRYDDAGASFPGWYYFESE